LSTGSLANAAAATGPGRRVGGRPTKSATPSVNQRGASSAVSAREAKWKSSCRNTIPQFRLRDEGLPLLHGHVHEAFREARTPRGTRGINVGVDVWDYFPVSEQRLAEHLEQLIRDSKIGKR
jgi:hypothetical protein